MQEKRALWDRVFRYLLTQVFAVANMPPTQISCHRGAWPEPARDPVQVMPIMVCARQQMHVASAWRCLQSHRPPQCTLRHIKPRVVASIVQLRG